VYVPVDDVEYVKVIEPPNVWDSDVLEKNLTWLKATGMRSIEVGPVGIISYMMPKGEYEKMIVEMYQEYTNSINSIVEEKKYEYVLEVSFNSLLSVFDIIVEGDEFNKDVRNFELLELLSDLGKRYGYMANVRKDRIEINVWDDESGELLQKDTISAD
jgi:NifB/MoaA-like Fe-S oxidoreductase